MTPDIVADVGNTRIKWGRCTEGIVAETCSLSPGDFAAWREQAELWKLPQAFRWAVAGVHPGRRDQLLAWITERGDRATPLTLASQLPLRTQLEHPDWAGIDRLLDAVAANSRRPSGTPAVIIDAGSAVTVDWLDETGTFMGGAIFPGARLMAKGLHDYTALLPEIEPARQPPALPGKTTVAAMELGIFWSVAGGIRALCEQYAGRSATKPEIFLTGGDAAGLFAVLGPNVQLWSAMTLEGIRLAAEALR